MRFQIGNFRLYLRASLKSHNNSEMVEAKNLKFSKLMRNYKMGEAL